MLEDSSRLLDFKLFFLEKKHRNQLPTYGKDQNHGQHSEGMIRGICHEASDIV